MRTALNETTGFHPVMNGQYEYELRREWNNTIEWATGTDGMVRRFCNRRDALNAARILNGT